MSACFCLTIRLLDRTFHGRLERGECEWPPSPSRAFQAIVAAAAAQAHGRRLADATRQALQWLERQAAPTIVGPEAASARSAYHTSVPNNALDVAARYWIRGNYHSDDARPATHRTMKAIRRSYLFRDDAVYYLWQLPAPVDEQLRRHTETLCEVAKSVIALGWGIDIAIAYGSVVFDNEIGNLSGEHWFPVADGEGVTDLRVPMAGTLDALVNRHQRFLARLSPDGFASPPPMTAYRTVAYRRAFDPAPRSNVAFVLLDPETDAMRPFDPIRHTLTVAHMMRHAVKLAARHRWSDQEIARMVMGHAETRNNVHVPPGNDRFAFLPLPTVEFRGAGKSAVVGSIRRVMLSSFAPDFREPIAWARLAMPGQELVTVQPNDTSAPVAILSAPRHDAIVRRYVEPATTWATVTPMVLPGYDDPDHYRRRLQRGTDPVQQKEFLDRLASRIDGLIRKAMRQAGFPAALAERATINWRPSGFWAGVELAGRYAVPEYLKRFPRLHVRIIWRNESGRPLPVSGPICLGGGRFFGLGLFASLNDSNA